MRGFFKGEGMKKVIILSLFLVYANVVQADFTQLSIWEKTAKDNQKQHLVILGDRHDVLKKGVAQVEQLVQILKDIPCQSEVIVEDAFSYRAILDALASQNDDTPVYQDMVKNVEEFQADLHRYAKEDVQDGLITNLILVPQLAQKAKVPCTNLEFRQLITYAPMTELIDQHGYDHRKVVDAVLENVCSRIKSFNDSDQLDAYYQKVLNKFEPIKKLIKQFIKTDKPMSQFSHYVCDLLLKDAHAVDLTDLAYDSPHPLLVTAAQRLESVQNDLRSGKQVDKDTLLKQIELTFCNRTLAPLLDALMVHELYQKQTQHSGKESLMCICAGLGHTHAIERLLPSLGYTKMFAQQDKDALDIAFNLYQQPTLVDKMVNFFNGIVDQCKSLLGF